MGALFLNTVKNPKTSPRLSTIVPKIIIIFEKINILLMAVYGFLNTFNEQMFTV